MPEPLASVEELAKFLKVPVKSIYRWKYLGQGPPSYKVGRHLRFRWVDVERWLSSHREGSG
jgi:excisionase family DNA binding protein